MSTGCLRMDEKDLLRLMVSFLEMRGLHCSATALERESGCAPTYCSEPARRLRSALIRGGWSEAQELLRGLLTEEEAVKRALFEVTRQKYVELICIYQELGNELYEDLGNAVAVCFSELTAYCEDPDEHKKLRGLASLARLEEDPMYSNWNPFSSRKECFERVRCILEGVSPNDCSDTPAPERLWSLLMKGVVYEACVEYCRWKAQARSNSEVRFRFGTLMEGPTYDPEDARSAGQDATWRHLLKTDSKNSEVHHDGAAKKFDLDCSLLSWLQTIPWMSLTKQFVQFPLTVKVIEFERQRRSKGWTETILEGVDQMAEFQDVKEKFWNDKILKNLIMDAPEILKRAEDVVNRWEVKRRMQNSKSKEGRCESYLSAKNEFGDGIDRVVRTDLNNGDNRVTKANLTRSRKNIFMSCELLGVNARKHAEYVNVESNKPLFRFGDYDRDMEQKHVGSGNYGMELKTLKANHVKSNYMRPSGLPQLLGVETGVEITEDAQGMKGRREIQGVKKTTDTAKQPKSRDAKRSGERSLDDGTNACECTVPFKNEISEPDPSGKLTADDFGRTFYQDIVGENFIKSGGIEISELVTGSTTETTDDLQNLVGQNFFERKRYITEMLRDKEILRGNLLQILAKKSANGLLDRSVSSVG